MLKEKKNSKVVCVLGMHRSGTSMVAHLLNMCGLYAGEADELLGRSKSNKMGHWEHMEVLSINREILSIFGDGDCWDKPPIFPQGWENSKQLDDLYVRAEKFVQKMNANSDFWIVKEPRMCLTLPFWQKVVPEMKYIIPIRHPMEVAQSLHSRDDIILSDGILLWLTYWREILKSTNSENRKFTFFNDYFIDCEGEVSKLLDFIDLPKNELCAGLHNVKELISQDLRHHDFSAAKKHFSIDEDDCQILDLAIESFKSNSQNMGKEISTLRGIIRDRDKELQGCQNTIREKTELILEMEKSKFWKMRNFYLKKRKRIMDFIYPIKKNDLAKKRDQDNIYENSFLIEQSPPEERVEIILVRYNNKEVEDKAIDCVRKCTNHPYKLTIYDNYEKNEGLSTVWNRLIEKSDCKYVCLLNTDAFVSEGWLEGMMRGFMYDEKVAAISPSSNNAKGQICEKGNIRNFTFKEVETISGFCFLIKKDVPFVFPEEVPFYGGEHAWCIEARRNDYKLLWSQGVWVEHLGESSAKKEGNKEELWSKRNEQFYTWLAETTPVLFTTYNRLDYTKKTLPVLLDSICGKVVVVDNFSTDGTREYLKSLSHPKLKVVYHKKNTGIAGAMNTFFKLTKNEEFVGKVDNDTIVSRDWMVKLLELSVIHNIDAMQAKHHIISTKFETFDEWMETLEKKGENVFISEFIGGSGIVIKRNKIQDFSGESSWVLGGWDQYQKEHPVLVTAFCDNVKIELLDMSSDNNVDYEKHLNYYEETGRRDSSQNLEIEIQGLKNEIDVINLSRFWKLRKFYINLKNGASRLLNSLKIKK